MNRSFFRAGSVTLVALCVSSTIEVAPARGVGRLLTYDSEPDRLESRCSLQSISGRFNPNLSQYSSRGICETWLIPSGGGPQKLQDKIRWEALGRYASSTDADETIALLRLVRPDQPNYYEVGRITAKMKCKQDPWRSPDRNGCTDLFYGRSESLKKYTLDNLYAGDRNMPRTSLLSNEQRAALIKQFQIQSASRQLLGPGTMQSERANPALGKAYSSPSVAGNVVSLWRAPEMIEPAGQAPQFIGFGNIRVRAVAPKTTPNFASYVLQLFTNSPAAQAKWGAQGYKSNKLVSRQDLEKGFVVPPDWFNAPPGSWGVRARIFYPRGVRPDINVDDPAMPWSEWKSFVVLPLPAAARSNAPIQLQRR